VTFAAPAVPPAHPGGGRPEIRTGAIAAPMTGTGNVLQTTGGTAGSCPPPHPNAFGPGGRAEHADEERIQMNDVEFDRAIKTMGDGMTRREVLRATAAGLIVAAGGGGIAVDALARKKSTKTKTKTKTCPPGTFIAGIPVPADGSRVFTPILRDGQVYVLRATGSWTTNADFFCDAFAAYRFSDPASPVMFNQGVRLGLSVDGFPPDNWGTYHTNHSYGMAVIGEGRPLSLQMFDTVFTDNSGFVKVEVTCGR
jgi:hypothetical protein